MTTPFEIIHAVTGDRAQATCERDALLAARTLRQDAQRGCNLKQAEVIITYEGVHVLTIAKETKV